MSTGRRLAKRSIIGTKVCAPGPDGLWYSGVIQDVKTLPAATITSSAVAADANVACVSSFPSSSSLSSASSSVSNDTNFDADTKYIVRFDFKTQSIHSPDLSLSSVSKSVIMEARRAAAASSVHISPAQTLRRNAMIKEFRESDLIGPGFRSILGIQLQPGQRVFLTFNGRETSGDVVSHDVNIDEVVVKITTIGNEEPIELKKRLEEVRLLESRRSARLADQDRDTDFARLADMGGDRRKTSHSIEVPLPLTPQHNSRKRRPSFSQDLNSDQYTEDEMNECNAALILMRLHNSPNGDKWLGSSPGSSSTGSWSSGSASPPLSDDGHAINVNNILTNDPASARIRTTSVSTSDEGIVLDFKEECSKKKSKKFRCTYKGCNVVELTQFKIELHIRINHLNTSINKKPRRSSGDYDSCSVKEEEFYYTEEDDDEDDDLAKRPSPASPPTLSHRDMARPPHEDPEYQRQIVGNFKQGRATNYYHNHQQKNQSYHSNNRSTHHSNNTSITSSQQQQLHNNNTSCIPTSPLAHHNYTWTSTAAVTVTATPASTEHQYQQQQQQLQQPPQVAQQHNATTLIKHVRSSPRPSHSAAPYSSPTYVPQNNYSTFSPGNACNSNNTNNGQIVHNNSSANNVLQQLSQQNVTVTAHHSSSNQQKTNLQSPQQPFSAVTITPNYHLPQPQANIRGQQQPTTASNIVANSQQEQPQQQQHLPIHHVTTTQQQQQQAANAVRSSPSSANRRTRGENKKCRKVYGMERRNEWCTQCKWKKACSRFGD